MRCFGVLVLVEGCFWGGFLGEFWFKEERNKVFLCYLRGTLVVEEKNKNKPSLTRVG